MKVYLAAPYSYKEQMMVYRSDLQKVGIEVTSRWLDEPHKSSTQLGDVNPQELRQYAIQDLNDVRAADLVIFFTDPTGKIIRAGRHVEFGIAVEREMPIYVLGTYENIFHYMPNVAHFENWDILKNTLLTTQALW